MGDGGGRWGRGKPGRVGQVGEGNIAVKIAVEVAAESYYPSYSSEP